MKTMTYEQGLAAAVLWLAGQLTRWGTRMQTAAVQHAAARAERQAQRRAAACRNEYAARRLAAYQARRAEWQAGQMLR